MCEVTEGDGYPISIRGLRKEYRSRSGTTVAVAGLDLDVPAGGVFGFLGPNGAGKTTTMRCLLGLVRPTAGSVRVLGADVPSELPRVIGAVGALVESPKFFPGFTGRLNLRLLADMEGYTARDVGRVLEEVGLADRADDLFSGYSLGMKQRLAVASTLLKDPELLILDEPANGLDPAGIREMRELIGQRADAGSTVFVSSHILAEVQLMCDSVAIIDRARLVTSGTVADVLTPYRRRVVVTIERRDDALRVLRDVGMPAEPTSDPFELVIDVGADDPATVTKVLADAGLNLAGTQERGSEPGSRVPRTHPRGERERAVRLFRVELSRFWSRRLMRLLVVGVAVGIVIYGVVLFVTHSPERPSVASVQARDRRGRSGVPPLFRPELQVRTRVSCVSKARRKRPDSLPSFPTLMRTSILVATRAISGSTCPIRGSASWTCGRSTSATEICVRAVPSTDREAPLRDESPLREVSAPTASPTRL